MQTVDHKRNRELEVRPLSTFLNMAVRRRAKQRRDSSDFDPEEVVFSKRPAVAGPKTLTFVDAVEWWRGEQKRQREQEQRPPPTPGMAPFIEWEEIGTGVRGRTPVHWDGLVPTAEHVRAARDLAARPPVETPAKCVLDRLGVSEPADDGSEAVPTPEELMRMYKTHLENESRRILWARPDSVSKEPETAPRASSPSTQSSVADSADRELSMSGFFD